MQLIKKNGDLQRQLGEQINENKHLYKENMMLKAEIEQLKNRKESMAYSLPDFPAALVAEQKEEYNLTKK